MGERCCFVCGNTLTWQRSTRRYCANACRQSAYRRRRAPRVWHRRAVRARTHSPPVSRPAVSLAHAVVRPIALSDARQVIEQREPMCGGATLAYGLFLGHTLASVVVCGIHPASNLSPRYHQTIALLRGVTLPWAPRNCSSKLIRRAMDLLSAASYTRVIAFSDSTLGERGVIYRAAGFQPIGASRGGRRVQVHFQGRVLSERGARRLFGTSSAPKLAALGLKVETVPRRLRWVARPRSAPPAAAVRRSRGLMRSSKRCSSRSAALCSQLWRPGRLPASQARSSSRRTASIVIPRRWGRRVPLPVLRPSGDRGADANDFYHQRGGFARQARATFGSTYSYSYGCGGSAGGGAGVGGLGAATGGASGGSSGSRGIRRNGVIAGYRRGMIAGNGAIGTFFLALLRPTAWSLPLNFPTLIGSRPAAIRCAAVRRNLCQ